MKVYPEPDERVVINLTLRDAYMLHDALLSTEGSLAQHLQIKLLPFAVFYKRREN
ncbi:hypothetical protein LCGC14_3144120 [marine sediment metagenome]|uniref:Uncharacterized protein n=1 Tax=marine sediment metagenome TaxID=412755 RepID=A0A0F8VVZ1_9ZZZZ